MPQSVRGSFAVQHQQQQQQQRCCCQCNDLYAGDDSAFSTVRDTESLLAKRQADANANDREIRRSITMTRVTSQILRTLSAARSDFENENHTISLIIPGTLPDHFHELPFRSFDGKSLPSLRSDESSVLGIRHVVKSEPRYALQSVLDDERRERRHSRAEIGSSTDSLRLKRRRKATGKVLPLRAERSDDFSGDASVANVGRVESSGGSGEPLTDAL